MPRYKVLALVGDYGHPADYAQEGLSKAFQAVGVPCEFTQDEGRLSAKGLAGVNLFVIFKGGAVWENRPGLLPLPEEDDREIRRLWTEAGFQTYEMPHGTWMTRDHEKALADLVAGGGGLMAVHIAIAFHPKDGPYRQLLGGHFVHHPPIRTYKRFTVKVVNRRHPVTKGVEDFEVEDEQYVPACDEDKITVLTRGVSPVGDSVSGWVKEYVKGRVCVLANGHTSQVLQHPQFQRLLQNGIRWCLRMEASDSGR